MATDAQVTKEETQAFDYPEFKGDSDLKWYVINIFSGYEKKVSSQITQRVKANGLEDQIVEVLIPTQQKIVAQAGKKKSVEEKMLPGYLFVKMQLNEQTFHVIRNTEGVTGFLGVGKKPTPLSEAEIKAMIALSEVETPSYEASFKLGDSVKVTSGTWKDFVGKIHEINKDKGQVVVLLSLFGRETPVTLDFTEITTDL
ncbi:MAG: transcription termination/antitermination factor NusG [Candidatus Doudnabacteria bacterium]|nr:transcription termination/antitermination factor NusG [Candidatus Doudnabacteria bacterium]